MVAVAMAMKVEEAYSAFGWVGSSSMDGCD